MKKTAFVFLLVCIVAVCISAAASGEDVDPINFNNVMFSSSSGYADVGPARIGNIKKAAEKLNGFVVWPGESFSFNSVCGPYTDENGYEDACVYYEGFHEALEAHTVGGGVSQLASNVYRCAMYTAMELDEHTNHRFRFPSIKMGEDVYVGPEQNEDGTLNEDGPVSDFCFTNTFSAPVKIVCEIDEAAENISVSFLSPEPYTDRCFVETHLTSVYHKLYTSKCIGFLVRPDRTVLDRFSSVVSFDEINKDRDGDGHIDFDRYNLFEDQVTLR